MKTESLIVAAIHAAFDYKLKTATSIVGGHHFLHYLAGSPSGLDALRTKLGDDDSHRLLDWIISHRTITALTSREVAEVLCPPRIGQAEWDALLAQARLLPEYHLEANLDVDVVENFILDGYSLKGICEVEPGDVVLDLGAFNGNSAIGLGRKAGQHGKVYAFEPNPSTQDVWRRNIAKVGLTNAELVPMGVSSRAERLRFTQAGAGSRIDPNGDVQVEITTVDSFVRERELKKVDFLKFDIEGFEVDALAGCTETIRRFRPKIAISVYHLHHDLQKIPQAISEIAPWYKMYLRHNANYDGEIVMYCTQS
jgi:FkbM family methyltransferase